MHCDPSATADWLIVCGDVSETLADYRMGAWAAQPSDLRRCCGRRATMISGRLPDEEPELRGEQRYSTWWISADRSACSRPRIHIRCGRERVARLSWRPCSCCTTIRSVATSPATEERALELAHRAGVVCSDEFLLHPDPYADSRGVVSRQGGAHRSASRSLRAGYSACDWSITFP